MLRFCMAIQGYAVVVSPITIELREVGVIADTCTCSLPRNTKPSFQNSGYGTNSCGEEEY